MRLSRSAVVSLLALAACRTAGAPLLHTQPTRTASSEGRLAPDAAPHESAPAGAPTYLPAPSAATLSGLGSRSGKSGTGAMLSAMDRADSIAASADLAKAVASVFGESAPLVPAALAGDAPAWDIDVRSYETHERVTHYIDLFTGDARQRFLARLSRGTRYEPMIRAKLRAGGLPEDMTYLALIESGYDPHAYSRAAAVGMWQFMSSTARDVGLRVDWWIDERRDPARATDGAILFLRDLQQQFGGSLYLAAAAYNGGPGRVARGLSRFADDLEGSEGEDRFFALAEQDYLRSETKNYVPQLIAAALVAKLPTRYSLTVDTLAPYAYDSVWALPNTSLAAVSAAGALTVAELRDLNPAILRGVTPANARYWVKVPVGAGSATQLALDSMPAAAREGFTATRIAASTSLASVAQKHGLTATQLAWFNPGLKVSRGRVSAGQSLRVPTEGTIAFAREIPDPSIERYGGSSAASTTLAKGGYHVVRRGETMASVAKRYGISVARLRSLNGIRGPRLVSGQTLRVKGSATASLPSKTAGSSKRAAGAGRTGSPPRSPTAKARAGLTRSSASSKSSSKTASASKRSGAPRAVRTKPATTRGKQGAGTKAAGKTAPKPSSKRGQSSVPRPR